MSTKDPKLGDILSIYQTTRVASESINKIMREGLRAADRIEFVRTLEGWPFPCCIIRVHYGDAAYELYAELKPEALPSERAG